MIELLIAFKWPIVLLILFVIFKTQISHTFNTLLMKTKNLTYKDFNLELGSPQSPSPLDKQQQNEAQFFDLQKAYQSSIITNEEKIINSQINEANLTPMQAKSVLTNHLANANFLIKMLKIDKLIYSEQICLLSFLNKNYKACTEHELFPFYEKWLEKSKNSEYTGHSAPQRPFFLIYFIDPKKTKLQIQL